MSDNTDFQFFPSPAQEIIPSFLSPNPDLFCADQFPQNHRKKRSKIKVGAPVTNSGISKPRITKKPDPCAPKITRPCSECGKKFWSWKALFGHMRCHPERQWRGINPPPNYRRHISPETPSPHDIGTIMTEDDHEVASCLLMLANSPSAFEEQRTDAGTSSNQGSFSEPNMAIDAKAAGPNCRFECSSCKKVFGSHQALGGHRASHKNVKGCFAITRNEGEGEDGGRNVAPGEDRDGQGQMKEISDIVLVHRCSICSKVFSSGQALGGHKRCHWEKGDEPSLTQERSPLTTKECSSSLDLNLPAPPENDLSFSHSSGLSLELRLGI